MPASAQTRKPAPAASAASRAVTLTMQITSQSGQGLADVKVSASGPVPRQGVSDPGGIVRLSGMRPGTYRVQFEHPKFVTFEKEVTLAAGKSIAVDVTMTAAPEPPPEPPPTPAPAAAPMGTPGEAKSMSLPDFIEKNLIAREPVKESPLGCSGVLSTKLIQVREPTGELVHEQVDETLYVVAGQGSIRLNGQEGTLEPAILVIVPRGMPYTLTRRGSKPLIVLSSQSGTPCAGAETPAKR